MQNKESGILSLKFMKNKMINCHGDGGETGTFRSHFIILHFL